jgi:NADPH:quinone reductase
MRGLTFMESIARNVERSATIRRVTVKAFGEPEQLAGETVKAPQPGPGQLLVDVEAAGVNYLDVYQRSGTSKVPLPYTPGLEGVGRIAQLGEGIESGEGLSVGQRIAWINVPGCYASQVLVPATQAIQYLIRSPRSRCCCSKA